MENGWRPLPTDAVLNRISQEFLYEDLVAATNNFSASCRLGEGTYGAVFRGGLKDGTEVAIKVLANPKEGGFREEVEVLSKFRHPNLVILMGFARNGRERYLVYELLPGGDLNGRLNKDATFTWQQRLNVALDSSLGLSHLHGSRPQVFHRDIKTQNILMDKNGTGKVADFGLACLAQPNQNSLAVSQTSGTIGYADPLYIRTGVVTEKSEVYSMGMVLLEVLTGRPPALQHPNGRIEYQFEHLNGDIRRLAAMVDRRGQWPPVMIERVGGMALQCTCEQEAFRPTFVDIVKQLRAWLRDPPPVAPPAPAPAPAPAQVHSSSGGYGAHPAPQAPWPQAQANAAQYAHPPQGPQVSRSAGAGAAGKGGGNPFAGPGQAASQGHHAARPGGAEQRPSPKAGGQGWPTPMPGASAGSQASQARRPTAEDQQRAAAQQRAEAQQRQQRAAAQQQPAEDEGILGGINRMIDRVAQEVEPLIGGRVDPGNEGTIPGSCLGREEDIKLLVEMGYDRRLAMEAFRRCSTVEAAVDWIMTQM